MQSLPRALLELLQSDDPDLLAQGTELLRTQSGDASAVEILTELAQGRPSLCLRMPNAMLPGFTFTQPLFQSDLRDSNLSGSRLRDLTLDSLSLCGADLRRSDLRGVSARSVDLRGANLDGADARGADLQDADLTHTSLNRVLWDNTTRWPVHACLDGSYRIGHSAQLHGADLLGRDLCGADLQGADLRGADLTAANLSGANLRGARLQGASLRGAVLNDCCLNYADLTGADTWSASILGADFRCAAPDGADINLPSPPRRRRPLPRPPWRVLGAERRAFQNLSSLEMTDLDWDGVDLRGADLRGADLSRSSLRGADLRGANLSGSILLGTRLDGARLSGCEFFGTASDHVQPAPQSSPMLPDTPNRALWTRAFTMDRPEDWRALGEAESGPSRALRLSWAAFLEAAGPRMDLFRGADRPLVSSGDIHARQSVLGARLRLNTPLREGSHCWHAEALREALSTLPPAGVFGLRWVGVARPTQGAPAEARSPWFPMLPLFLVSTSDSSPLFPRSRSAWPSRATPLARAWLWGGEINHLDIWKDAPNEVCDALLAPGRYRMLETLSVQRLESLAPLTQGPPRPSLRAIYIRTQTPIVLPDLSAGAPHLERLEICGAKRTEAPHMVRIPRLHLSTLRRLSIYAQLGRIAQRTRLTTVTLENLCLPGLLYSDLFAEQIRGLSRALPQQ